MITCQAAVKETSHGFVIIRRLTQWSLHQIQGGAMNAAYAHVSASLLYKAALIYTELSFVNSFVL